MAIYLFAGDYRLSNIVQKASKHCSFYTASTATFKILFPQIFCIIIFAQSYFHL